MKVTRQVPFVLIILYACSSAPDNSEKVVPLNGTVLTLTEAQYRAAGIQTAQAVTRPMSTVVKLNGKIDVPPQSLVSIGTAVGGFLKSSALLPGMTIKKGDVLATLEDLHYIQLQQDYLVTRARLRFYEQELLRQKALNESKASSDKLLQQAEMDYQTQKVNLKALAEQLRLIQLNPEELDDGKLSRTVQVYSPINGVVSKVHLNTGAYANAGEVLFELINPDDIHLNLRVFEKDLGQLAVGQKVIAYSNAHPERKYTATVLLISPDVDADRSAEVHCHFDRYDETLLPGMYMNAEVSVTSAQVLTIASEAVVHFGNDDFVLVAHKHFEFRLVKIVKGGSAGGWTTLTAMDSTRLNAQPIVTRGAYALLAQLKNTNP